MDIECREVGEIHDSIAIEVRRGIVEVGHVIGFNNEVARGVVGLELPLSEQNAVGVDVHQSIALTTCGQAEQGLAGGVSRHHQLVGGSVAAITVPIAEQLTGAAAKIDLDDRARAAKAHEDKKMEKI